MTKEEMIDKLWGRSNHGTNREDIEAAYNAGAEAEREACAKACERLIKPSGPVPGHPLDAWLIATVDCAEAIRARGN